MSFLSFIPVCKKACPELLQQLFIQSWWVWAFSIACFGLYEQASYSLHQEIVGLEREIEASNTRIQKAELRQEELKLQLRSLSDPAWIELELIQGLGVVPQGYKKIYFQPPKKSAS